MPDPPLDFQELVFLVLVCFEENPVVVCWNCSVLVRKIIGGKFEPEQPEIWVGFDSNFINPKKSGYI